MVVTPNFSEAISNLFEEIVYTLYLKFIQVKKTIFVSIT
jgi:hypothetical protein